MPVFILIFYICGWSRSEAGFKLRLGCTVKKPALQYRINQKVVIHLFGFTE